MKMKMGWTALASAMLLHTGAMAETAAVVTESANSVFAVPENMLLYVVIAALVIALIVLVMLRAQLKTAAHQSGAGNYIREGSFDLLIRHDRYTHTTEQRRRIEQKNN